MNDRKTEETLDEGTSEDEMIVEQDTAYETSLRGDVSGEEPLTDDELRALIEKQQSEHGPMTVGKCREVINNALDQLGEDGDPLVAWSFNVLGNSALSSVQHAENMADKLLLIGLLERSKSVLCTTLD